MSCLYFFTVTGKCIPLRALHSKMFNILSISACFGKTFFISMPVLIRLSNSCGSWKYDLSSLWYVSEITPSQNGEFSSKSVFSSGSMSDKLPGILGIGVFTSLGGVDKLDQGKWEFPC